MVLDPASFSTFADQQPALGRIVARFKLRFGFIFPDMARKCTIIHDAFRAFGTAGSIHGHIFAGVIGGGIGSGWPIRSALWNLVGQLAGQFVGRRWLAGFA
jgi:hypothetical protein